MNAEPAVNEQEMTASPQTEQQVETQVETPSLTQDDVNRIVAERVQRERAKFEKKYSGIDLDRYNELVAKEEQTRTSELEKRGEYEKLLKEQADKFNTRISQYEQELQNIKVDGSLLTAASNARAVNPEQVAQLLKTQLRLNEAGAVDVLDNNGQVRYNDNGEALGVTDLVNEFLTANPHFVSAGPQGSGTGQGVGKQSPVVDNDISKLDMKNPEHRRRYAEIMRNKGIRP